MLQANKRREFGLLANGEAARSSQELNPVSDRAGGWLFWLSAFSALMWLAAAAAFSSLALKASPINSFGSAELVIGAVAAFLPAALVLIAGLSGQQGARARAEARRLADAAMRMLSPSPAAEAAARRLGISVRGEVAALDRSVMQAISRIENLDSIVAEKTNAMGQAVDGVREGADELTRRLETERAALLEIGSTLVQQASAIGAAISNHREAVVQAAEYAEAEIAAADEALESRLTSFAAAASLIADRTEALNLAAKVSAESALRLESALSSALEILAKATALTDAARQSSEQAVQAASMTANALRETTAYAIEESKRAADIIRAETANVQQQARGPGSQSAHSERPAHPAPASPVLNKATSNSPIRARWNWRHLLSDTEKNRIGQGQSVLQSPAPAQALPQPQAPARSVTAQDAALEVLTHPARDMAGLGHALLSRVDLHLESVFNLQALERIAQAARRGTQSRRRSVREQAPDAVLRLSQLICADSAANALAEEILRGDGHDLSELLTRGRAPLSAEATRVFLLVDAAYA